MPSLTIYIDQKLDKITENLDLEKIELKLNQILVKTLNAKEENCQIIWINSKIFASNYKIYCELKYRQNDYRDNFKLEECLNKMGDVMKVYFKVKLRLRSFGINQLSIKALDL